MNKVIFSGRLTKNPELRKLNDGTGTTTFGMALQRRGKDKDKADFPLMVAYGKTAELIAQYFKKGSLIEVEGRVQTRSYEQDKRTVYVTEFIVENFGFLESKRNEQEEIMTPVEDDDIPF